MSKHLIDFIGISKSYDSNLVLDDLNLYVRENEFLTLLGPSGCGKTTTLRLLGGFESPDKGQILFDGQDITALAANERKLNTVFQKYSLFPHMSIAENIAFGLKISKKSKAYIQDKIKYALKLVNLEGFENRSVDSLSGGQQQRIAIARAIVNEPKVLLLDEPLGALDLKLRQNMQYELIRLKEELGITFVYVTHDQEEALTMSDTIVVMNQGYIQQIGTPENIYNEPENAFVADFIGHSNIIDGTMIKDELVEILGARWACVDKGFGNNKPVDVVIRPEDVELVDPSEGTLQGEVTSLIFKGVHYELDVMAGGYEWLVHTTRFVPVGTKVGIKVIPFNIQIMHKPESSDEKAVEIGCEDTWFITPNGLDATETLTLPDGSILEKEHHTTAKDLACILRYCIRESSQRDLFREITRTQEYCFTENGRSFQCHNHNAFLQMMDGAFTGKTGFTNKAGYCYVGALKRDGKCLIVALLACGWPNHKTYKWSDSRELFTYGLENFTYRSFEEETFSGREQLLMPIPVLRAQNDALTEEVLLPVEPDPETEGVEGLLMGPDENVEILYRKEQYLTAPVEAGECVGEISYLVDGWVWRRERLIAAKDVEAIDFVWCGRQILLRFLVRSL